MFGKNPIVKVDKNHDGQSIRIVEGSPFYTIQGEGPFAGQPAIFVRLHGCNLACTFCDTDFSNPNDPTIDLGLLLHQIKLISKSKLVVITGGEPMRQNIFHLCRELHNDGYVVQIETAGTLWIEGIQRYSYIICSPKTPSIHDQIYAHARAFKYIISATNEHQGFIPITATQAKTSPHVLASPRPGPRVYLSPMDEYDADKNKANMKLVAELAMKYDCVAGVQLHKFFGLD